MPYHKKTLLTDGQLKKLNPGGIRMTIDQLDVHLPSDPLWLLIGPPVPYDLENAFAAQRIMDDRF